MNTLKNIWYNFRIRRKWEKLTTELYLEDVNNYIYAVNMANKALKNDCKALKACHKTIVKAMR